MAMAAGWTDLRIESSPSDLKHDDEVVGVPELHPQTASPKRMNCCNPREPILSLSLAHPQVLQLASISTTIHRQRLSIDESA